MPPVPGATTLSQLSVQLPATQAEPLRLLMIGEPGDAPLAVRELLATRDLKPVCAPNMREARNPAMLAGVDAVLICDLPGEPATVRYELKLLEDALLSHRLTGVVLSQGAPHTALADAEAFLPVLSDISADELWGRLATIRQYRPLLRRIDSEVAIMQRLGKKLNQQFVEVDQELRLASRLQRDFLPKTLPSIADIRFDALFRPATWVSGDIYDVRRLDETHVSFYVADAVGHGVAAGLLTMFIRQAVIGKRVGHDRYSIVPPDQVLAHLNTQLAQQELPNCQFVTACYGHLDTRTHELTISRGGHPHPVLVSPDGVCSEVRTTGGLLGVFPGEEFPSTSVHLAPGSKLLIYSDGLEDIVFGAREHEGDQPPFSPAFQEAAALPADKCIHALAALIDKSEGSIQPTDDQTCIVLERLLAN